MNQKGILYGVAAYTLWGLFPIYWKWLHVVPAPQLLSHRIGWSFITLMIYIFAVRQWPQFRATLTARNFRIYLIAAILIAVNWLTYVWAVNSDFIVETSLGYFINPLLSVLLGVIFFRERLRRVQWAAVVIAAAGVAYLAYVYGRLPLIALLLAFSFGFYGLVKKMAPLNALHGLTLETGILFLPALAYLSFSQMNGTGAFLHDGTRSDLLMIFAGPVTAIPLLMFASAARLIPLTIVGLLQYIAPTLQFLVGVFIYREPFSHDQLIGFCIVWLALVIFAVENFYATRAPAPAKS